MTEFKSTEHTKILVPATKYDITSDGRLLIPFTEGPKIGFMDRNRNVVVKPEYSMYYGDCYSEDDFIRVAKLNTYGYPRANGDVATYHNYIEGLINSKGELVLPLEFMSIKLALGNNAVITVRALNGKHGVITLEGEEIVPFDKYQWIDSYELGLARVIGLSGKWGIINETGEEVIPLEYSRISKFVNEGTYLEKDGGCRRLDLSALNPALTKCRIDSSTMNNSRQDLDYVPNMRYGEYTGSYAQDYMDYDDDYINDAFDGDPDAYWNID